MLPPYSHEIFQFHLTRAWKKRKETADKHEQVFWEKVIRALHADFERRDHSWVGYRF